MDILHASAGDTNIAYAVLDGEGDREVVMVNGYFFPIELLPEDRIGARLLDGLTSLGRVAVFDRRGIGSSDPVTDWDRPLAEQWCEDLLAVVDAAGMKRPSVFSWSPTPVARLFAARHPGRIDRLVLFQPVAPWRESDHPAAEQFEVEMRENRRGVGDLMARSYPRRGDDQEFRRWLDRAGRFGASPASFDRISAKIDESNEFMTESDHAAITAPTLVVVRPEAAVIPRSVASMARVADLVADGSIAAVPGGATTPLGEEVDALLAEISGFVAGEVRTPAPDRQLSVILFTDIVASTAQASELGDHRWRGLIDGHDSMMDTVVKQRSGVVVKTTGDGVLALLPSISAAHAAVNDARGRLATIGLSVRAAIHVGEVDLRGQDISGIAVHMAARILSLAEGEETLASEAVRLAAEGSDLNFVERGDHELKGIDGLRRVYVVTCAE